MYLGFPYHLDASGRSAEVGEDEHVRQMIEQVLFTAPGERVNRPTFGAAVRHLLFRGNDDPLAAATQFIIKAALQEWLKDRIEVLDVDVEGQEAAVLITVRYRVLRTGAQQQVVLRREV